MKKLLLATCLSILAMPAMAEEKALERVMDSGTIRCGYVTSPGFLDEDPNTKQLSGMDYDTWEKVGRILDVKIEWVQSAGWGVFPEELKQGKFDAYCSQLWLTPGRIKYLTLTQPVAYTFAYAYVRPDDTRFSGNDPEVFNSESISVPVLDGDVTEYVTRVRFPNAKRLSLSAGSTFADGYMAVTTKKADVLFIDDGRYKAVSANNPVKLKKLDMPVVFSFGARYGFAPAEYGLRDMVNTALQSMVDDGSLETYAKASSPDAGVPARTYKLLDK